MKKGMHHWQSSRSTDKGDYTNDPSEETRGPKYLNYTLSSCAKHIESFGTKGILFDA